MKIWTIEIGEPIPGIDVGTRTWRCGFLSQALAERGDEVVWWASTFDHSTKAQRFSKSRTVETQSGLSVRLLFGPGYARNSGWKRIRHHRYVAGQFRSEIENAEPPDLIFCCLPTLELAEVAVTYGRRHKVPVLVDVRDQWPDIYLTAFPPSLRSLARSFLTTEFRRARRIFHGATGITAVSQSYLDWALNFLVRPEGQNDGVYPLGYNAPSEKRPGRDASLEIGAQYGVDPEALLAIFVGSFGASYDLETVIKGARQLEEEGEARVQFLIVGDGDQAARLKQLAAGLSNVLFTGWVNQEELLALLSLASIGLVAYRQGALQSLPNKPYEYMAAGLPLLSSLEGELSQLIDRQEIGYQYRGEDIESFVDGIRWALTRSTDLGEIGGRARDLFDEHFDADVVYPRLIEHLDRVVSRASEKQENLRVR